MKPASLVLSILFAAPAAATTIVMLPSAIVFPSVYWGVEDPDPMVVTYDGGRVSFSRLGDEQCMDKLLGAVPCELEEGWGFPSENESVPVLSTPGVSEKTSKTAPPPVQFYYPPLFPPPLCCRPPPPPPPPPPSAVALSASSAYLLGSIFALALWSTCRKRSQE